ncbi:MAG: indole-3-glycerol phosphate synthase TrpC [Elusimicrobiota bacterium]
MTESVLEKIAAATRTRIAAAKARTSEDALRERIARAAATHSLLARLRRPGLHVISEIKLASPSAGSLGEGLDPAAVAADYAANGAAAISVLTEPQFFRGELAHLEAVRRTVELPVLMKDFLLDQYQILQARAAGADAVLLIAALLGERLPQLLAVTEGFGLDALVEVHDEDEMRAALDAGARLVGVNNRNLKTLAVDLETSRRLARYADRAVLVCESGLRERRELDEMLTLGYRGFLIGTQLIRGGRPGAALAKLLGRGAAP